MSKKTLIQADTNSYFTTTNLTNKPSFIQAKNKLLASAKREVNKNGIKSNILAVLSKNDYVHYMKPKVNKINSFGGGKRGLFSRNNTGGQWHVNTGEPGHVNTGEQVNRNFSLGSRTTNYARQSPNPVQQQEIKNTYRIYILCFNKDRLNLAFSIYSKYIWAVPILMKYQNYTFENAFWKQLLEMKDDWINSRFVGSMSFKAYEKVNLDEIDKKIMNGNYTNKRYVHFADSTTPVLHSPLAAKHPNLKRIWLDVLAKLNLNDTTESLFNYFMCTPTLMYKFISWYSAVYLPVLISHPLMFTNANYTEGISKEELVKLWGKPYYPHLPFVMERLNKCFFQDILNQVQNISFLQSKIAFLFIIPDNKSICGGIRTLLTYIKYLNTMDYSVDFYFGNCTEANIFKYNLSTLLDNINNYGLIDVKQNNFYLGLRTKRDYDILVANAWQISDAVYAQRYKAKKLAYIIQDREELFYPGNNKLQTMVKNTYKPDYNYYCLSKYLANYFKNMFPDGKVTDSVLGFDSQSYFIKNMSASRSNSIVIAYYTGKPGRLPGLVEKIIQILSIKYKCYIYPDLYNKTKNGNIINCGKLSIGQLNNLYNNNKVGIVFSNTNPSRLGFEMVASGLNVIEYASEFTQYDLDTNYFTLIKNEENITSIVDTLMNKHFVLNHYNTYKNSHNNEKEKEIVCDFFRKLL